MPRGLRPLTVTALCGGVAVLAVLLTQTVHPPGATSGAPPPLSTGQGNAAAAPADGDSTDSGTPGDATPSDEPSTADSTAPDFDRITVLT